MLVFEEAERRIQEVGGFSSKLEEVLLYMLKDSKDIRDTMVKENEAMKAESEKRLKEMEKQFQVVLFYCLLRLKSDITFSLIGRQQQTERDHQEGERGEAARHEGHRGFCEEGERRQEKGNPGDL